MAAALLPVPLWDLVESFLGQVAVFLG